VKLGITVVGMKKNYLLHNQGSSNCVNEFSQDIDGQRKKKFR
jgi:hypothetical protein